MLKQNKGTYKLLTVLLLEVRIYHNKVNKSTILRKKNHAGRQGKGCTHTCTWFLGGTMRRVDFADRNINQSLCQCGVRSTALQT